MHVDTNDSPQSSSMVYTSIPRPLYNHDAELDLASCLVHVIETEFRELLDEYEIARVIRMLEERYRA